MVRQICIIWDTCSLKNIEKELDDFIIKYRMRVMNYLVISSKKREYKILAKRLGILARLFKIIRVEDIVRRLNKTYRELIAKVYHLNNIYNSREVVDKDAHLALGVIKKLYDCCDIVVVTDDDMARYLAFILMERLSRETSHYMIVCDREEVISCRCISRFDEQIGG